MKEIQKYIKLVKNDIQKRFPGCSYTINILLWDDNTSLVECRYGTIDKVHISKFHNNTLTYEELDLTVFGNMVIDGYGKEYFSKYLKLETNII